MNAPPEMNKAVGETALVKRRKALASRILIQPNPKRKTLRALPRATTYWSRCSLAPPPPRVR